MPFLLLQNLLTISKHPHNSLSNCSLLFRINFLNLRTVRERIYHRYEIVMDVFFYSESCPSCMGIISLCYSEKIKIYRNIIFPVVLYGCETWSLTLREERRLTVSENSVLRRIDIWA
jgi:hypothetical protein